jgi:putative tricarboxylic transport membrane protein
VPGTVMRAHWREGEAWAALGVIALGAFLMFQTSRIEVSPGYARVGPSLFPWLISSALVLLGLALLREALTGRWTAADDAGERTPFKGVALFWVAIGLVLFVVTITPLGFPIAAGLLFAGASRAFGSTRSVLDVAIGFVLGVVVFVGFNYGLGLSLPAGVLGGIL